jgi:shikimate dehydrogenase
MRTYGLIGYPLGHSFSRKFFTEKFSREAIPAQYLNFEIEKAELLLSVISTHPELAGLNVTIPYKEQVIPFLHFMDTEAMKVGAVNTIRIKRQNEVIFLEGFNTDVYGFTESLRPLLKPFHTAALILGAGGASKAIRFALHKLGIA